MMPKIFILLLLLDFILGPGTCRAEPMDPVTQTIEKALSSYHNNDFRSASSDLNYAIQLIRQKKGEALTLLLPPPLGGWTTARGSSRVTAASLFGGGLTAKKTYIKDDSVVEISIGTDSPLMQSMILMFSNPLFALAAGEFELINGYKGIVNYQFDNGDITIVVNNRFLVNLTGRRVSRSDLLDFARSISLQEISKIL